MLSQLPRELEKQQSILMFSIKKITPPHFQASSGLHRLLKKINITVTPNALQSVTGAWAQCRWDGLGLAVSPPQDFFPAIELCGNFPSNPSVELFEVSVVLEVWATRPCVLK